MNLNADFCVKLPGKNLTYSCTLQGNIWGIFGPSGAGKTTFFHSLSGLRKPDSGHLLLNNIPLYREKSIHIPPQKRKIGYVFQDYRLFPHLSVLGNLRFGESMGKQSRLQISRERLVDLFGLNDLLNRMIPELSGGEMQRVAIARALLCGPELLLLDEPFKGLDPHRKNKLLKVFRELIATSDLNVLFISHQLDDIFSLTDRLLLIDDGTVVAYGNYLHLLRNEKARLVLERNRVGNQHHCLY